MILSHPFILKCPECGALHNRTNLISGNSFGGIFWSDGYYMAPMLPDIPRFSKCYQCGAVFNVELCEKTESEHESTDRYPEVSLPDKEGLMSAIENNIYKDNIDDEIYLRIKLWQEMNPRPFQINETVMLEPDENYRNNAQALLKLLDPDEDYNLLIIAEIHRNLSEFKESLASLAKISDITLKDRTKQIKNACKKRINGVIRFQ
ncbi:MAG: hypothetical protein H6541_11575 [Lentimicrobiaceae bacterium]|nr:hypothetical protein [Lentimicrobiaceae bacterium]